MNWTNFLFSFQGRINRGKWWLTLVLNLIVWFAFFIVCVFVLGTRMGDLLSFASAGISLWLVGAALLIATNWAAYAVGVKRLHDRNKSGWWILLFYLVPSLFSGSAMQPSDSGLMALSLISFILWVWGLVELGFLRGTSGANQYGPDPLGGFSSEPLR